MQCNVNKSHKHKEKKIYYVILFLYYSKTVKTYPWSRSEGGLRERLWYGNALFLGLGACLHGYVHFQKIHLGVYL